MKYRLPFASSRATGTRRRIDAKLITCKALSVIAVMVAVPVSASATPPPADPPIESRITYSELWNGVCRHPDTSDACHSGDYLAPMLEYASTEMNMESMPDSSTSACTGSSSTGTTAQLCAPWNYQYKWAFDQACQASTDTSNGNIITASSSYRGCFAEAMLFSDLPLSVGDYAISYSWMENYTKVTKGAPYSGSCSNNRGQAVIIGFVFDKTAEEFVSASTLFLRDTDAPNSSWYESKGQSYTASGSVTIKPNRQYLAGVYSYASSQGRCSQGLIGHAMLKGTVNDITLTSDSGAIKTTHSLVNIE